VLIFFVIRYRRRTPYEIPRPIAGSHKLETLWTIIPFVIAMTMFGWGAQVYFQQYKPPANAIEVYVVGKQWMWKLQHATGQREINQLHIPVGRKIKLIMTSEDVIHDFFVPAFRTKMDVVPGKYTTMWFEATKVGSYHIYCDQFCGTRHAAMIGEVIVMTPQDYEAWLAGGTVGAAGPTGEQLFRDLACVTCHLNDGTGRGPSLADLPGSTVKLTSLTAGMLE